MWILIKYDKPKLRYHNGHIDYDNTPSLISFEESDSIHYLCSKHGLSSPIPFRDSHYNIPSIYVSELPILPKEGTGDSRYTPSDEIPGWSMLSCLNRVEQNELRVLYREVQLLKLID